MDFSLTEEQQMLQKMARVFLTTECPKSLFCYPSEQKPILFTPRIKK